MIVGSRFVLAAVVAGSLLGPASARAQAAWPVAVEDPQLVALIEEALSKNPDVAAARKAADAESQRPAQARALRPDAVHRLHQRRLVAEPGHEEMTTLAVMASQDLPFPGKRALRGEIAAREAGRVEQQAERRRGASRPR